MGRRFCVLRGCRVANIQKVLGRHRLLEGFRKVGHTGELRPTLKCTNCARTFDLGRGEEQTIKHDCPSDIDLRRLGRAAQQDQLERDMRGGLYRS
jgi:hypothetical protein